jgi:hypothetical protein
MSLLDSGKEKGQHISLMEFSGSEMDFPGFYPIRNIYATLT